MVDTSLFSNILIQNGPEALCQKLLAIDHSAYQQVKQNEGQCAYIKYVQYIRFVTESVLYSILPGRSLSVAQEFCQKLPSRTTPRHNDGNPAAIILPNDSFLAHVSVLVSMSRAFSEAFGSSDVIIVTLAESSEFQKWKNYMESSGLRVAALSSSSPFQRLCEADALLELT